MTFSRRKMQEENALHENLLRCPKCAGKRIWVIERYRVPGEAAEGRELPVVPHQAAAGSGGSFLLLARVFR